MEPEADGSRMVIVRASDETALYAASVVRSKISDAISVRSVKSARAAPSARVAGEIESLLPAESGPRIQALRPLVRFRSGRPAVTWEVVVETPLRAEVYEYDPVRRALELVRSRSHPSSNDMSRPQDARRVHPRRMDGPGEWLATNVLHHPEDPQFRRQASSWVEDIDEGDRFGRAKRICSKVYDAYRGTGEISGDLWAFTWSDHCLESNARVGRCDEFAVVACSYLRSLGIPSRIKLLRWDLNGRRCQHTCLEFEASPGRWIHMDPYNLFFAKPHAYRTEQDAGDVHVMDADEPDDTLSNRTWRGLADPPNDGKLHPYRDFATDPPFPGVDFGERRRGYSN